MIEIENDEQVEKNMVKLPLFRIVRTNRKLLVTLSQARKISKLLNPFIDGIKSTS
jgi:hypothetical protein